MEGNTQKKGGGLYFIIGLVVMAAIAVVIAVALMFAGVLHFGSGTKSAGSTGAAVQGEGFDSAEDASKAFAEALKTGDIGKMMSTFAVESYAEHFDHVAYVENMRAIMPNYFQNTGAYPVSDERTSGLAKGLRTGRIADQIAAVYQNLALDNTEFQDLLAFNTVRIDRDDALEEAGAFKEALAKAAVLDSMDIGSIYSIKEFRNGIYADMMETFDSKSRAIYNKRIGAEESSEWCVELTIDGQPYILFCTAVKYDSKWYILQLGGNGMTIANVSIGTGGLVKLSELNGQ